MDPTTDIAFKKLFANKEKPEILISFLNSILALPEGKRITSITLNDPNNLPETILEKHSIVDVSCTDQQQHHYIVEMQVMHQKDYAQRAQFYVAHALARQLRRSDTYDKLRPVIFVGILNFKFSQSSNYTTHHYLLEVTTHEHVLQHESYHFVELPKFKLQLADLTNDAEKWVYFMKHAFNLNEEPSSLARVPAIDEAFDIMKRGNWTQAELIAEEKYWDSIRVATSIKKTMYEQGKAEGKAEGEAKGRAEGEAKGKAEGLAEAQVNIIGAMLKNGMTPEDIAKIVEIDIEEIKKFE